MVILISTNLLAYKLPILRQICDEAFGIDLSVANKTPSEALIALSMAKHDVQEHEALELSIDVQRHISFTYFLKVNYLDYINLIEVLNGIATTTFQGGNIQLVLATASLEQWRTIIQNYSNDNTNVTLVRLLNTIQQSLESLGLAKIFQPYFKRQVGDIFYLCYS